VRLRSARPREGHTDEQVAVVCVTAVIVGCALAANALFGSERTSHAGVRARSSGSWSTATRATRMLTASGADAAAVTGR
jgi:hypothetical protein